jgi:Signal transduction histidine kinase
MNGIHDAGKRAEALTRQLLAFSRRQVLEPKVLDLNQVIADLETMLRRLIGEDIVLSAEIGGDLHPVKVDPGQFEQVLINLSLNARDAMPRGGRLLIETKNVNLDDEYCQIFPDLVPGPYVMLAVTDTGTGINDAVKARIFEPFFTTKEVGKGTGLGLATVFGIVKQSEGHVAVYSEEGIGSSFKIYLPVVADGVGYDRSDQPNPILIPRGTESILLVEDEDSVRILATQSLEEYGYQVLAACDGDDALKKMMASDMTIDILVSDVVMPHLGGRELAEKIVEQYPTCKVLFLSGYTEDAIIRHGIIESEFSFLQKPFTPSALARKVREVLDAE